jgi:hypothetical protein
LFVRAHGVSEAPVYRLNLSTGRRTLWRVLAPSDPAGAFDIAHDAGFRITPDGRGYAFTYWVQLAELSLGQGLK